MKKLFVIGTAALSILLSAGESFTFTNAKAYLGGRASEGKKQIKLKELPNGLSVKFGKILPGSAEVYFRLPNIKAKNFESGILTLELDLPESVMIRRIVVRMADAKGEIFQFKNAKTGIFPKGRVKLEYVISEKGREVCWGGDKKIDFPLRLAGVSIDLLPKTAPESEFILRKADFKVNGEDVSVSIQTGHPLNLLLPGGEKAPFLNVKNEGTVASELKGTVTVTDYYSGKTVRIPVSVKVAPESASKMTIPGKWDRQGCWLASAELHSAKGQTYRNESRFGKMDPVGKTPIHAKPFLFGVCSHLMHFSKQQIELEALAMGLSGIKIVRTDFTWFWIEPKPGKVNYGKVDFIVKKMAEQGVEVEALLGGVPDWAKIPVKKWPDLKKFSEFAGKTASHYQKEIRYFEIWNEPDHTWFANFPATHFYSMVKECNKAIKKANPKAFVMTGGLAHVWFNNSGSKEHNNGIIELLVADKGRNFDVFGYHGHGTPARYYSELQTLEEKKIIGPAAPRPWYSNETAESSIPLGGFNQAKSVYKKFLLAWSKGAIAMNWYLMRNKDHFAGTSEQGFGLITGNFQPKPAYIAYNALAKNFTNGKYVRTELYSPELVLLRFADSNNRDMLAVWGGTNKRIVCVTGIPDGTEKIDLFGNTEKLSTRNGDVFLELSDIPFTLRAPAGKKIVWKIAGDVFSAKLPQILSIVPGGTRNISMTIFNPGKKKMQVQNTLILPKGIKAAIPAKINLNPGDRKGLSIQLKADPSFKASVLQPLSLQIRCAINGGKSITFESGIVSKNPANVPLFELNRKNQYHSMVRGKKLSAALAMEDGTPVAGVTAPKNADNRLYFWWGREDLSAKIWVKRDTQNISMKIVVTDDIHFQPKSGYEVYNGDNIQCFIQVPGQSENWELGFTKNAKGKDEVFAWHKPAKIKFDPTSIALTVSRDEKRKETTYQVMIPFMVLGMTPAQAEEGIRFNLLINDNDGKCRKGYIDICFSRSPLLWPIVNLD